MEEIISFIGLSTVGLIDAKIESIGLSTNIDSRMKIDFTGLSVEPDPNSYITIQVI